MADDDSPAGAGCFLIVLQLVQPIRQKPPAPPIASKTSSENTGSAIKALLIDKKKPIMPVVSARQAPNFETAAPEPSSMPKQHRPPLVCQRGRCFPQAKPPRGC